MTSDDTDYSILLILGLLEAEGDENENINPPSDGETEGEARKMFRLI